TDCLAIMKRYGVKRKVDPCPNRLFLSYIKEWRDEAKEKEQRSYHTYNKALKSLEKYPPLQSGKEAIILENFGDKICSMLDRRLAKDADIRGMSERDYLESTRNIHESWWGSLESEVNPKKKQKIAKNPTSNPNRKKREYVPVKNSGAYALLIALYRDHTSVEGLGYMKKAELQREAQKFSTKSFSVPDSGCQYTAWSSMGGLIAKNLVNKHSNPAKYHLTDAGIQLAEKLDQKQESLNQDLTKRDQNLNHKIGQKTEEKVQKNPPNLMENWLKPKPVDDNASVPFEGEKKIQNYNFGTSRSAVASSGEIVEFRLNPGEFEVLLCVDTREISGDNRKKEMQREIEKLGIPFLDRVLQIGDFVWVARGTGSKNLGKEVVLDYVVERKCMSDLAQSIRDGRFHEQKIRLKQCGSKKVIYLIEQMNRIQHQSLPEKTLRQALLNTQVIDSIFVKYSENIAATAEYLGIITSRLRSLYQNSTLLACEIETVKSYNNEGKNVKKLLSFGDFNDASLKGKGLTVSEMFTRQLMQIRGVSYDKANSIIQLYPTPIALMRSYKNCDTVKQKQELLAKIKTGLLKRNFGISLSRTVYHVF
uniref:Crossover junction endonuclease MUS81 n=1 Tax=Ciona savignyi TaxID=51511 RepID=H2YH55_CIOSA